MRRRLSWLLDYTWPVLCTLGALVGYRPVSPYKESDVVA